MESLQQKIINIESNNVTIAGKVISELELSHQSYGESFYRFELEVPRLSDTTDVIKVIISERFFGEVTPTVGDNILIYGQFRSHNNFSGIGNKLILTVFVKEIELLYDLKNYQNPNNIFLKGFICKPPIYRTTPFKREIADILLAVNRSYNKSDYIPCIAWGRNAKFAETLEVGTPLKIWGRIQSRTYKKRIDDEDFEEKTAYEVSISKMEIC